MRILHITTAYPRWRGDIISPWLVRMLIGLKKRGHRVSVFTSSYRGMGNQVTDGIHVFRFRYAPKNLEILTHDMAVPERMKQGVKFKLLVFPYIGSGIFHAATFPVRHDIVHVHWPIPHILFGLPMKYRWKAPLFLYIHGGELNFLKKLPGTMKKVFINLLNHSDYITVNSSYTKRLVEALGVRVPIEVIPFGNPHADRLVKFSMEKPRRILFVGRLIRVKGLDDLIRAFKIVKEKFPDAELRLVGEGPMRKELENLARELGVPVTFAGYKSGTELEEEYLSAGIFVLPSKVDEIGQTETLGVVTIEALSYGLPVVASNIGGIPDVIINEETGLLFESGDYQQLAEKIITIFENPVFAAELVERGQKHINENYSWDRIVARLEDLYRNALAKRR